MTAGHSYSKHLRLSAILLAFLVLAALIHTRLSVRAQDPTLSDNQASRAISTRATGVGRVPVEMNLVRVATAGRGEVLVPPGSNYSSFNLDSTRFLIQRDGRTALYAFNPTTLAVDFEGFLFDGLELEDCYWSAFDAHTIFGFGLSQETQRPQIYSFDLNKSSYTLVKDFSEVLPNGTLGGFSKARTNDEHFSFAWRESTLSPWHYIVVWDRSSDAIRIFDLFDPATAVSDYQAAYLNESGNALVVRGEVTRVWHYMLQPQQWSDSDDSASSSERVHTGTASVSELDAANELWYSGPRHLTFERYNSTSSIWDVLPYQAGNRSRDGRFFIFNVGDSGNVSTSDVFIATTATAEVQVMDQVTWINAINCTATENTLKKTSGEDTEDAGAMTLESLEAGDGFIEFVASDKKRIRSCGFSSTAVSPPLLSDFDYAIQLVKKKAYAYEKGVIKAKIKYKANNNFRLEVEGDVVKYSKNGKVFYTSGLAPSYPLFGAASLVTSASSVANAMMAGGKTIARVTVSPAALSFAAGASKRFNATVTGVTNTRVNWSATGGSITSDGIYTAPSTSGKYVVSASSVVDPNATGSAIVHVTNPDSTPHTISNVLASGLTSIGALISWSTNEESDSQVDYGATNVYGMSTSLDASPVIFHSVSVSGLSPSTLYHFRVKSRDAAGNLAASADFTFTTAAALDITAPVISAVSSSGMSSTGVTISWATDEASDSQVDYGVTVAYGVSNPLNPALVASHSVSLDGLSASTPYHYRVKSRDAAGNLAMSGDFTFTTAALPDTTPPVISAVSSSGILSSGATVSWNTNEASDSQVDYGTSASYGNSTPLNSSPVTGHSAALGALSASTLYHYRVKSRDAAGNLAASVDFTFTTQAAPDTTPPIISAVASSGVTSSGATISWTTNEASNTQVDYGTTTAYGASTALNTSMVTSHSASISGLAASTLYHYRVKSRDAAGNLATSADFTFATQALVDTIPPVISGVSISGITTSGATVSWITNEASNSRVDYGTTTAYGSSTPLSSSMVTSHSASLSGLTASTLYHYRANSRDAAGNLATSGDFTFTTSAKATTSTITVNPGVSYQTMVGWDAVAQINQMEDPTNYRNWLPGVLDAAMDTGINRLRVEIRSGAENPTDYYQQFLDGQISFDTVASHQYEIINDDSDPNNINASGFNWARLNFEIESIVIPMRNRLAAQGESLYWTICYVDFGSSTFEHKANPNEYAEFVLAVYQHLRSRYGLTPNGWEVILEPDSGSASWSTAQITDCVVAAQNKLLANGITPNFILPSNTNGATVESSYSAMKSRNAAAITYVSEVSYHRYTSPSTAQLTSLKGTVQADGKSLYMSEWIGADYNTLHADLTVGNNSSWQQFTLAYDQAVGDNGAQYLRILRTPPYTVTLGSRTKFLRQYFKYVRRGAVRKDASSGNANFSPVAFLNTDGRWVVVVKCSASGSFTIGGLPAGNYGIFYTTASAYDQHPPNQLIGAGQTLSVSIPAAGVLTVFMDVPPPSDTAPPVISAVSSSGITSSGANINWSTNEASDTQVEYGLSTLYGASTALSSSMVTSHSSSVGGLLASTLYHYRVRSRDAAGNLALSGDYTFTTSLVADTTPPVFSGVSASGVTSSGATVNWTTNEASDSQAEYGTTTGYGSTTGLNPSMVTSHSVVLSGMSAGTLYHYRLKSRDAAGNLGVSGDFTFTTSAAPPPTGSTFYVALNGSSSGNGSISSPWDLQSALNQPSSVQPGATIYLRGGTYKGKFTSSLSGSAAGLITVRSYPGEWARIDGYVTTTLTNSISSTATAITVADGSALPQGQPITFHDGTEGSEEVVRLQTKNGTNFTIIRGWNGTTPVSHASGALVVLGGNQITVNGFYSTFRDLEITNSDPVRQQAPPNSQNAPHLRGEGFFNLGAHNKIINCIIHDVQDGYFNGTRGVGPEVYGNIIFNNGYVAAGVFRGHGLYLIHSDASSTAYIKENIVFNNAHMGIKGDSQNGDAVNIWTEGNVSFNHGAWSNDGSRNFNLLMASNNGLADAITVKDNYLWHPIGVNGGQFVMGLGGADNGRLTATSNYILGGGQAVNISRWATTIFAGNTVNAGTATPGNPQLVLYTSPSATPIVTWNSNSYYDNAPLQKAFYSNGSSAMTFSQWKSTTGFDSNSTEAAGNPTSSIIAVRPNLYDTNQANIVIYDFAGSASVAVDLSGALSQGDSYAIYSVENIFGPPIASGTYSGGMVTIPTNGNSVAQPVGWSTAITTMRPRFAALRLWRGTRSF